MSVRDVMATDLGHLTAILSVDDKEELVQKSEREVMNMADFIATL